MDQLQQIMKLTITKTHKAEANKDGQPYLDRNGRPQTRVSFQTKEQGNKWISGFSYAGGAPLSWKEGDTVEVDLEQKGDFLNFRLPRADSQILELLKRMDEKIDRLISQRVGADPEVGGHVSDPLTDIEELPF